MIAVKVRTSGLILGVVGETFFSAYGSLPDAFTQ
ncbi:hypothetical protein WCLP8_3800015 [uncultured Gammaproteobacteria bacterium]